jgi:Spy/CpxP family protein refolding chaperone
MHHAPWKSECETLEMLELSADQREAVKGIEAQYKGQILESRQNLMVKRLELQNQLRNGNASEASIRNKSDELEEARRLLYGRMMDYQLHVRRILTPEQLRRWCTMIGEAVSQGGWKRDSWCR